MGKGADAKYSFALSDPAMKDGAARIDSKSGKLIFQLHRESLHNSCERLKRVWEE
jgi:hypothetical protein